MTNMVGTYMIKKSGKLSTYTNKRDFAKTTEPQPKKISRSNKNPLFVIQEHHASHLHWDLRLEIDGVLKSWAIPKGPSINPKEKRLAVQTEDHPLAYATFEGIIPEGEYGAGIVMVWDIGTYKNVRKHDGKLVPMALCYKNGRIEIELHGKKLHGLYALIHFKPHEKNWLFFKVTDAYADTQNITKTHNKSALSNRTIDQISIKEGAKPFAKRLP